MQMGLLTGRQVRMKITMQVGRPVDVGKNPGTVTWRSVGKDAGEGLDEEA
jgi:hypothetical protein